MVAAEGNIMRKTPQEAYDLIENMTQHHFQWNAKVYYDTTPDMSAHYFDSTYTSIAPVEVLGKQTAYTIQSVQPQPGPSHPNSVYYLESDESDEDEPSEVLVIQRSIHHLSVSPTSSFDPIVGSLSPLPTPFGDSDSLLEETDTFFSHSDDSLPDYETFCFDIEEKSSGSTTSQYHFSLLEYESFHFDLSIDQFPPADMSDLYHEEFVDELAHIISLPEYDRFYFDLKDDPVEVTKLFKENIPKTSTEDLTRNELNDFPLILSDCDSNFSKELFEINIVYLPSVFTPGTKKFRESQARDSDKKSASQEATRVYPSTPKPKASARRKMSDSYTSITPPTTTSTPTSITTVVVAPRLTTTAKGKQPAKAKSPYDPSETMATTIEQQVALDEALVPSTKRLRIGRSNFRLPLEIQSKEPTLQVVYDVLRGCPFFKAFFVTADVPEIYMQEFWATAYVHQ
nr:hypothetical protein [Tanacetum cinerariifolium]